MFSVNLSMAFTEIHLADIYSGRRVEFLATANSNGRKQCVCGGVWTEKHVGLYLDYETRPLILLRDFFWAERNKNNKKTNV